MKTKDILIELIELLFEYEQQTVGVACNMSDFVGFLNARHTPVDVKAKSLRDAGNTPMPTQQPGANTDISILIVLMFRYAKSYIKKALADSEIKTADEFSFLITLLNHTHLSKTELINKQVMEKTSGMEIIKRLVKLNLMEEVQDENDKRSIRVALTAKGRTALWQILPQMQMVSRIVVGNLDETEKNTLAYLLRKLELHHNDIYTSHKDFSLSDLLSDDI